MTNDVVEQRDREIEHLQAVEGAPFDAEDRAMFAEFDRLGLSPDEQRGTIVARAREAARKARIETTPQVPAAE